MTKKLIAALCCLLLAAGCGTQPDANPGPSGASHPTPATSQTPAATATNAAPATTAPATTAPATKAPVSHPATGDSGALKANRDSYGIAECPDTDLTIAQIDKGLPKTALECLGGTTWVNLAGLPRRPMFINLWAAWCEPCRAEMPDLVAAHKKYGDRIDFLGIITAEPATELAMDFAGEEKVTYPQVIDMESKLKPLLQTIGLPTSFFVSADGTIFYRHAGPLTGEALETHLKQLLGES